MCHNQYYENGTKKYIQWRKHESKVHFIIRIGEKRGGAGANITKKNDKILVNVIGVPKEMEVSLLFSG